MATSHSNNLNVGMKCIKYMLFTINFMFVVSTKEALFRDTEEPTLGRFLVNPKVAIWKVLASLTISQIYLK